MKNCVLVTGGAGYIGSHAVRELQQNGYKVIVLDNLSCGHREFVEAALGVKLIIGDISDRSLLSEIFSKYDIQAVMHFAAHAYVGESIQHPNKYYNNNTVGSIALLEVMKAANVKKLIFSSTCATYGIPTQIPVPENHPQAPINPYGWSKLMVEQVIRDFSRAYELESICFRYFNAAGAHPAGDLGEDHAPEPHLIPKILYTALGKGEGITIYGTDYPTPDGTCIRDYIHVLDIARAHVRGLDYLLAGGKTTSFNLGTSKGFSVREMIDMAREITGQPIDCIECDRRPGDPPILIGDYTRASQVLGWEPKYSDLRTMLTHAWAWHQKRHGMPPRKRIASPPPEKDQPLVSVIIPAYNASPFIERTLITVLNQTYRNIEVLVVDDGSTDSTPEIVQKLAAIDDRLVLLQQANAGVAAARNYAIAESKGDFIAPIDADDIWHKTNIEKQLRVLMESDENVAMVYSWSVDIDEADCLTGGVRISPYYGNVYPAMLLRNVVGHASACMIRRRCLDQIGHYKTSFLAQKAQGCEDWDIYLRIAKQYQVKVVPELLVGYRQVPGSMSRQRVQMLRSRALALQTLRQQFPTVYRYVSQWCVSEFHIKTAQQHLQAHDVTAAWLDFSKAVKTDALIILANYRRWKLFVQLLWCYLLCSIQTSAQITEQKADVVQNSPSCPELNDTNISLISRIKIYGRFVWSLLSPVWIIQFLRICWLNAVVCPHRAIPKSLTFAAHRSGHEVQTQTRQGKRYLDFGQSQYSSSAGGEGFLNNKVLNSNDMAHCNTKQASVVTKSNTPAT